MVGMLWRVCLITSLLVSCFIKPDPPGVAVDAPPGGPGDAAGDSAIPDDAAITHSCANPNVAIKYMGLVMTNCGSWAMTSGGPISTTGGPLDVATQNGGIGSCTSNSVGSGAFISIVRTPTSPGDTVFLNALTQSSHVISMKLVITASARTVELTGSSSPSTAMYDPAAMAWWRLSADGPTVLVGEYSSDGTTWTKLGTQPTNGDSSDKLTMSFGVTSSGGSGSAAFGEYDQCP